MREFNLICAVSLNGVIGDSVTNTIPWHIPSDLKRFKSLTTGRTVVMGAKTYNSLGKNLPNRRNVVITRGQTELVADPHAKYNSFAEVLRGEEEGFFVIGGEHIFGEALKYNPARLYMTLVLENIEGDVHFPIEGRRMTRSRLNDDERLVTMFDTFIPEERSMIMDENGFSYQYVTFKRR